LLFPFFLGLPCKPRISIILFTQLNLMFLPLCGTLCTSWDRISGRLSFFLYGIWCTICSLHISFLAYPRPSVLRCFLIFAEIRYGIFCSHRVDPGAGDGEMAHYLFCRRLLQCWRRPYSDQPLLKRLRNRRPGLQPEKTRREVLFSNRLTLSTFTI